MASKNKWLASIVGIAAVAVAGVGIFQWQQRREENICHHSWRDIHPGVLTIGEVDGKQERFCCPACALTTAMQTGKPVRILRLTDFNTQKPLDPKEAFLVRGSDANLCAHPHPLTDQDKQSFPVHFDRCLPSMVAFGTVQKAEAFQQEHGGEMLRIADFSPHLRIP